MSYKTILVHADLSSHAPARIRFAAALANTHGAHLVGAATTGVSRFMSVDSGLDIERAVVAGYLDRVQEQARQGLAQFEVLARECCTGPWEARLVADDPEGALVRLSCFADLIVLDQPDAGTALGGSVRGLPEHVILHAARPVLLLPHATSPGKLNGKALVAWDGSLGASRALAQALPLLCASADVLVAQFDATPGPGVPPQADNLGAWLARHGVAARVEVRPTPIDAGKALLALAAEWQAGLLVMGAYGHTRLRELVLGGVTRTVLKSMTAPVLMAH
jgi:nucleotide-binding universal stress UspA family protein